MRIMISRPLLRIPASTRLMNTQSPTPKLRSPLLRPFLLHTKASPAILQLYSTKTSESLLESKGDIAEPGNISESSFHPQDDIFKQELEAKNKEIFELKDKYLRSVADFRNLQDRTARDVAAARDFAISKFAKDLLDSVDNFDRALSTVPATSISPDAPNKELQDLHSGLKMTESVLMQALARNGLERFDPSEKGEAFDPNLHEATFMTKVEGKQDGTCFNTVQKGFKLNGRVIRAAKVGVVKNN